LGNDIYCPTRLPFPTQSRSRFLGFHPIWRRRVARLATQAGPIADLADSFPALLFALASGYGTRLQRKRARAHVEIGHSLKVAAKALDLPFWLRRIPASAFTRPLPEIPGDMEFAVAVSSRLPSRSEDAAIWFDRILFALTLIGRDFAVWLAVSGRLAPHRAMDEDFQWLVAWAWHATRPETGGAKLLRRPWSATLTWKKANEEIAIWRKRIDLAATLGDGIRDPWFADGHALGLHVTALRTVQQFIDESVTMENCLDQYARHLTLGRVRVFSVRKAGRSVANLELALRPDDATMPGIVQLRGPRNRRVSTHVWQAVHAWLGSQPFRAIPGAPTDPACAESTLRALWKPYLNALASAGAGGGQIVPPEAGRSMRLGGPNSAKAATVPSRSPNPGARRPDAA
jgi:hypothetical protein